jgi:hypothetical protein
MGGLLGAVVSAAVPGLGCAAQQVATIEPSAGTAGSASETPSSPTGEGQARPARKEEGEFVLSKDPSQTVRSSEADWIHVGDAWWKFRGDFIKASEANARERDNAISEKQAPNDFWDRQTAVETAMIWTALCNECHGGRRRIEDALGMPAPPLNWGKTDGLFFGQRRQYSYLFNVVFNGGGTPKEDGKRPMPPWKGKLAKEQIWSLLYFLEYQSGGIEGRFAPSLYPRQRAPLPE